MKEIVTGSCHCGSVKYEIRGAIRGFKHCHCRTCRKVNGTAFASSAVTNTDHFHITNGREKLTTYNSSNGKNRYFCSRCGSPIYAQHEQDLSFVILRVGTFDVFPGLALDAHIWTSHEVAWYDIPKNAPHYPEGLPLGK
jgi:hypothetical protein